MRLVIGLGNPGPRYAGNRHNIGFMAVDAIARRHGFPPWRKRFHGVATEGPLAGERVMLLKPETYMNESGRAVQEAAQFYKVGLADIVVLHDELDLPPGKVRLKTGGGAAGHNGLRSIGAHLGNDFRRVRIGIGHPGVKEMVQNYVLQDFAKAERAWVETLCDTIADNAGLLAKGQDATFQNKVHLAMQAKGFLGPDKEPPAAGDRPERGAPERGKADRA
jgi:PTH1 family peptidyl-tRNA hydrolase